MDVFWEFISFQDPGTRYVTLGAILLTASSAVVGTFTFLKKKALVGDAVAHAVLPGVCLAFLLSGNKNPFLLIIGAFATGWISLVLIDAIKQTSKIKEDTAIALILSVFFGLGILLLTAIQSSGNAAQSGLDSFLFGKAASLVGLDLWIFSTVAVLLLLTVGFFYKSLALIAFDEAYARAIGFPVRWIELVLTTLTVMAVVIGIQAVGVVLMAAMLITPPAAARYWTDRLIVMVLLAATFGAFSGFAGAFISYAAPSMPTGPWIVVVITSIAFLSFFLAPRKGILYRLWRERSVRRKILHENILKTFYHLGEQNTHFRGYRTLHELSRMRNFNSGQLKRALFKLRVQGYVETKGGAYRLTGAGLSKSRRIVRLHRLWELYLTEFMHIAPDHVHDDADTIEHIITPEIEARLAEKLEYPTVDPHQSQIPSS